MASKTGRSDGPAVPASPDAVVEAAAARLPAALASLRWFGAKTRAIAGVVPVDRAAVPGTGGVLAIFRVDFAEGPPELYGIPLLAGAPAAAEAIPDAMDDPAFCAALVQQITAGG